MSIYLPNELAPWERASEYRDGKEIKNQLTEQTKIAKQQLAVLSRDYPLAAAGQYSYDSYLDANRYGVNDDAIYAVEDGMYAVEDAMKRNAEVMDAGFDKVSGDINEQTSAMKKGMAGIALTQAASTALIMKTLNENASFLAETMGGGFDLLHGDMQNIALGVQDIALGVSDLAKDFNIAMGSVLAQMELSRVEMKDGLKHISSILVMRRKTDAQEHFEDALGFYKDGNRFYSEPQWFRDAKKHFLESIKLYARNPLAHLYLGHIYHYQKEHRDFKKALEHYRLSAIYGMADEKTHCIAAKGYFFVAWLQASVFGNIEEAIKQSKEAIKFDPEFLKAYYYLAKYYAKAENASDAISLLENLITQHDRTYATRVLLDPDFEPIIESVKQLIERLKLIAFLRFAKLAKEIRDVLNGQKDEWERNIWYVEQSNWIEEVVQAACVRSTYFDYLNAADFLNLRKNSIKFMVSFDIKRRFKEEQLRKEQEKADKKKILRERQLRKIRKRADRVRKFREKQLRQEQLKQEQIQKEENLAWQCWYMMFKRELTCLKSEEERKKKEESQKARQRLKEWRREEERKKKEKEAKFRLKLLVFFVSGLIFILLMAILHLAGVL